MTECFKKYLYKFYIFEHRQFQGSRKFKSKFFRLLSPKNRLDPDCLFDSTSLTESSKIYVVLPTLWLTPLKVTNLPIGFLVNFFKCTSSASSNMTFMYSSNPMIWPSILRFWFSYNHICTLALDCRYRNIRFWEKILRKNRKKKKKLIIKCRNNINTTTLLVQPTALSRDVQTLV